VTPEKKIQLRSLAREAIRCALVNISPDHDQAAKRAQEALREFQAAADPLAILDLLDAAEPRT